MLAMMLSGITVLSVDLLAKDTVERRGADRAVRFGTFADIRHVASHKVLYSRAPFRSILAIVWAAAFLSAVTLSVTGWFDSRVAQIAIGAALGGAAGNLFDIIRSHSVRDYIDLGWWPVFNLADVAILGGLALAFLSR